MTEILIDGTSIRTLAATDRGLHYGDGVFETVAVEDGRALCLARHLDRLAIGCQRLGIPLVPRDTVMAECQALAAGRDRAVLKIIVTRGSGGRGYQTPADVTPTRVIASYPWPSHPLEYGEQGVPVTYCAVRLGRNRRLAGIKHLNRLEQVLARSELDAEVAEGLMLDDAENVIEGTMSNLFIYRDGTLVTPDLGACGVQGIIRDLIVERCRALGDPPVRVASVPVDMVSSAEEAFLCNSVIGVWPIRRLSGRDLPVGPVTRRIRAMLAEEGAIARRRG